MLAVISPAKKLKFENRDRRLKATKPVFLEEANQLAAIAKKLSRSELRQLMKLSDKLADLNYRRFQDFRSDPGPESTKQAVLAFAGDTYTGLSADTMSDDDLMFAQDHLRILSGLYGVLRPLDAIQPYRLEMGRALANPKGRNLYAYWGDKIARQLDADLEGHPFKTVINLASNEYFKAIDRKALKARVVHIDFKQNRNGTLKTIGLLAKRARGAMARYMIDNRLENPEDLKGFNQDGYQYHESGSSEDRWLFVAA